MSNMVVAAVGASAMLDAQNRGQRLEGGIKNLQIMGALSLYQGHQLSKSVENLNVNLQHQTALLENIAGGIGVVASKIDDVKREQVIARLKQEREEIAKETVFQFKQECGRVAKEPDPFRAYFMYLALDAQLEDSGITTRDLPNISDKEYLAQVEGSIATGLESSMAKFSDEQTKDFEAFNELSGEEFDLLEEIGDFQGRRIAQEFSRIKSNPHILSRSDLEEALDPALRPQNLKDYYRGISLKLWPALLAALIGGLVYLVPEMESKEAVALAVLLWVFFVVAIFFWNILRKLFTSRMRLQAIKERVLNDIQRQHSHLFTEAEERERKLASVVADIERRRAVAAEIASKYAFLKEPLAPYLDFDAAAATRLA